MNERIAGQPPPGARPGARVRRRRGVAAALAAVLVVLLVVSLLAGLEAARDREAALDTAEPGRAPEGVVFYDLTGDERPEYVAIGDEILPVIPPRVEAWWVPFVPFFATVLSAVIAAVAVIVAQRPHADIVRRLEALERDRP